MDNFLVPEPIFLTFNNFLHPTISYHDWWRKKELKIFGKIRVPGCLFGLLVEEVFWKH